MKNCHIEFKSFKIVFRRHLKIMSQMSGEEGLFFKLVVVESLLMTQKSWREGQNFTREREILYIFQVK